MQEHHGPFQGPVPIPERPVEPLAPPAPPRPRRERWVSSAELFLAFLLNLIFFLALFWRPQWMQPEQRKEPPAISVQLVPPSQAPPKPQPQPKPQDQAKEQPKPKDQPKPEEKKPEEKKPEEKKPEQKKEMQRRESGGDPKLKQGAVPKVEKEKTKERPEKAAKKPKPEAPRQPAADIPDWAKKMAQGYDLPKPRESRVARDRGSNVKSYSSQMVGEGGGDAYLNAMRDQVNAHLVYPQSAGGNVGAATYGLVIDRTGALRSMRLLASSGRRDLDMAAGDAIMRSAPFRPLPPDYDDIVSITAQIPVAPRP